MDRKTTRRDFLIGRLPAALPTNGVPSAKAGATGASRPASLVHVSRPAMAGEFQIFLNAGQYPHGVQTALEALELLEPLERQMSVFRADSLIQQINQQAAFGPVEVEDRLFGLLELADHVYHLTEGAFDLTATPLWEVWGFAQRRPRIPTEAELAEARARVGWQYVRLDPSKRTIEFTRPGLQLNLGSIGKGYAVDRCAEILRQAGIDDWVIHGGQSSVLAHGQRRDMSPGTGWPVGVRHPLRPDRRLGQLLLKDRALGTSGSGVQFFCSGGRRWAHIIDPRTGQPGEGVLSVTVLAPTAAEADALATGLFLLGVEKTRLVCQQRPDLAALFVLPSRRPGGIEVVSIGISEPIWQPQ
ncbi:MAG TPA: FAD:protein FMN transferase [Thermoguttaceae bacterium]|nr:FAD:protein FMN transferase [Thermoguttaceae bacterium]